MIRRSFGTRLLFAALLPCVRAYTESPVQGPSEYQVKAAFLYNFVKFVEWPASLAEQRGPIVMCVIGKDPFGDLLVRAVEGKSVNGRPIVVRNVAEPGAAVSCQVLFVSTPESGRLPEIAKAVRVWSVLTVGESERFAERGGMVGFLMEGQKVRFQINAKAAAEAGLQISSKLLQLSAPWPGNKGKN
jgi:hypothetical protein